MKIQPIFITCSYNKPAFRASIAKDEDTKKVLNSAMFTRDTRAPQWMYYLLKVLENMNSEDTISFKRNFDEKKCTIKNNKTGNKVDFYMESPESCTLGICRVTLPEALFWHINSNLQFLFEDTTYKDTNGYKFKPDDNFYSYYRDYLKNTDNVELENQKSIIEEQNREYSLEVVSHKAAIRAINQKIKANNKEITRLDQIQVGNCWRYIKSTFKEIFED